MPFLLDTDWVIQVLSGAQHASESLKRLSGDSVAISWFSVAELYEGAFHSSNPQARLYSLRLFVSGYRLIMPDDAIAERFAEIRSYLRRRGELIPDFDLLIAATALRHDLTLLTFNVRHLGRVPDLRISTG
jgi:predicted nucleic acid-binding protein